MRTARAKGLSELRVLFSHVLQNAMIPILTGVVVVIPLLFMGSLITESFFGIPGLGSYTIDAINSQDFAHRARHGVPRFGAVHRRPDADRYLLHPGGSAGAVGVACMHFKPVILWTDALIYLLLAVVIAFVLLRAQHGNRCARPGGRWRAAAWPWPRWWYWRVYVVIGLLDSLHFRPALAERDPRQ